ncbi:MAG: DHH family phosphoesterase, partial [Treponemataceae bacterium]|nr:DHH family phosphoesterase [Treponemataceae bacterium]
MQIITDEQAAAFNAFLATHDFFYIIGHKEPDGDCVYSCLSMGALLDAKKQSYQLLNAGSFKRAEIKNKAGLFTNVPTFLSEPERRKTGVIMLDCSETARL